MSTRINPNASRESKFLIGITTAAHHIEGNNIDSDWWQHEQELTGGISSGQACNSYVEFKRDRKLLQALGSNSYRFSIEWSRIEPRPGKFSRHAIGHYCQLIDDLNRSGIEPVVTLHHFTNPAWFEERGGWQRDDAVETFLRFVKFIHPFLQPRVRFYTPINEPNVYVGNKYVAGVWHPYRKNPLVALRVLRHLALAHTKVYALLKASSSPPQVGSCVQHVDVLGLPSGWWPVNLVLAGVGAFIFNHLFYLLIGQSFDFVGLNFYSTYHVGFAGFLPKPKIVPHPLTNGKLIMTSKPIRLLTALRSVSRYGKPILITENGKLTTYDTERRDYLCDIFALMKVALREGIMLMGYLHFTHLDSFEWGFGFGPKFGLFSHDPTTHKIRPKPSAKTFSRLTTIFLHWHAQLFGGKV